MKNEESKRLKINFPPVMTLQEIGEKQQAGISPDAAKTEFAAEIPPSIRSIIELSHIMLSPFSQWLHATPGFQQGLLYKDKTYCLASGYRDGSRPRSVEDKGNIMRLRDPLVYGSLSIPIAVAYLCHLHGQEAFDLNRPITHYLPELSEKISNQVTARSILSFETVLNERIILKDIKAHVFRTYLSPTLCTSVSRNIYEPIENFFNVCKKSKNNENNILRGKEQRENLIRYIQTSNKLKNAIIRVSPRRSYISHFTIALLIAAVERQLKEKCFEESIEQNFFWKAESKAVGYGKPQLWRDPHSLFYQPTGMSMQHLSFKTPITEENKTYYRCAPAIFNASLNLYGPVEECAKLLSLSLDVIRDAQDILQKQKSLKSFYDFGLINIPKKNIFVLKPRWIGGLDALPSVVSLRFNDKYDYGVFTITNCGTRFARFFTSLGCRTLYGLVYKHLIFPYLNTTKRKSVHDTKETTESYKDNDDTPEKVKQQLSKSEVKTFFKNLDAHTWS